MKIKFVFQLPNYICTYTPFPSNSNKKVFQSSEAYYIQHWHDQVNSEIPPRPTDASRMQLAIPFLPLPLAIICTVLNVVVPGAGWFRVSDRLKVWVYEQK